MADKPKIEIPADLTQPYTAPDGATVDQLKGIAAEAQEQALGLLPDDGYTDEDLDKARWLASVIEACNTQVATLEQADQDRRNAADEVRNRLGRPEGDGTEPDGDGDGGSGDGGDGSPAAPNADTQPEAVTAAGGKPKPVIPSIGDVARQAGKPVLRGRGGAATLVAAADVPGFAAGAELTREQLGEAWNARARGFANFAGTKGSYSAQVARVRVDSPDDALVASGRGETVDISEQLRHACDETRLPGGSLTEYQRQVKAGSLTAASGWCAPTEPLYELLNLMSDEGLVSVPEITVKRGGVQWSTGPDFTAVWSAGQMFTQTEAQNIANTPKPMVNVPCPATQTARMNADGLFLTSEILAQHGWPEATADFLDKAQIVFQHYVSAKTIADIVAGSTAVNLSAFSTFAPPFGALATVLGAVALQIEDMKYRGRLSRGQSVEVKLPFFARNIFRSDLWKREGTVQDIAVTDAQIDEMFTVLGVSVEYVYDWQDNVTDAINPTGFGGATAIASWPQTFQVLMYPSGTWARAIEPVIDLNAVYDSTLLAANKYVALFQEQGRLTIKRGFDSRIIKVSSIPSGVTGGTTPTVAAGATPPATPL